MMNVQTARIKSGYLFSPNAKSLSHGFQAVASSLLMLFMFVTLTGCANHRGSKNPRFVNDSQHNAAMLTRTVLVPGVPFSTNQNAVIKVADSGGRDFELLVGPYPINGGNGTVVTHNSELEIVLVEGFAVAIGKQPHVKTRTGAGSSSGTHFTVWSTADADYYFVEQAVATHPVRVTEFSTKKVHVLSEGEYVKFSRQNLPAVRGWYFNPRLRATGLLITDPVLVDFVTYTRWRTTAGGFTPQNAYFMGSYQQSVVTQPSN